MFINKICVFNVSVRLFEFKFIIIEVIRILYIDYNLIVKINWLKKDNLDIK